MAALTAARVTLVPKVTIKKTVYPLGINKTAYEGAMACVDTANLGAVWPGAVSATLKPIGKFLHTVTTAGTALPVGVELTAEQDCEVWDSVTGGGAITIANLFQVVYIATDHELTTVATGASIYGTVLGISPQGYPGGVVVKPVGL